MRRAILIFLVLAVVTAASPARPHPPTPSPISHPSSGRGGATAQSLTTSAPDQVPAQAPPMAVAGRKLQYLEISHRQMRKLSQSIRLDEERLGVAALSAAALAAAGRPTREDAARWVSATLELCAGRRDCGTAVMALQRIALQYQETLSQELLGRVLVAASRTNQAPGEQAVREPWSFKETENQRIVRMARNLVAFRLDPPKPGTPRAAAEQGWTAAAEAFLLAHDREGWYEAESPGYIAASMTALLHLADHAGSPRIRELAARQLDLLFAEWAQEQINGFPAGPKSRTYVHWALGAKNTPWLAWAWLAGGINDSKEGPEGISFMDWPEIATSSYEMPDPVKRLLKERDRQPPYEIRARRSIAMDKRLDLDTALYSYATPDYILGAAQSVRGVRLGVSGGQEIMATLYAACAPFAPLYLWSRTENPRSDRWKSWAGNDQALAHRNVALARLGAGGQAAIGHAWMAAAWEAPEILPAKGGEAGEVVVTRCGDTYAALVTEGGWEVKPAPERFPAYYGGDKNMRGSWVAVPRRQPAVVALEVGRRAEHGSFAEWKKKVAGARLVVAGGEGAGELRFAASDGTRLAFLPGERATVGGRALAVDYPLLAGPFLASEGLGRWTFSFGGNRQRFETLKSVPAP